MQTLVVEPAELAGGDAGLVDVAGPGVVAAPGAVGAGFGAGEVPEPGGVVAAVLVCALPPGPELPELPEVREPPGPTPGPEPLAGELAPGPEPVPAPPAPFPSPTSWPGELAEWPSGPPDADGLAPLPAIGPLPKMLPIASGRWTTRIETADSTMKAATAPDTTITGNVLPAGWMRTMAPTWPKADWLTYSGRV